MVPTLATIFWKSLVSRDPESWTCAISTGNCVAQRPINPGRNQLQRAKFTDEAHYFPGFRANDFAPVLCCIRHVIILDGEHVSSFAMSRVGIWSRYASLCCVTQRQAPIKWGSCLPSQTSTSFNLWAHHSCTRIGAA